MQANLTAMHGTAAVLDNPPRLISNLNVARSLFLKIYSFGVLQRSNVIKNVVMKLSSSTNFQNDRATEMDVTYVCLFIYSV